MSNAAAGAILKYSARGHIVGLPLAPRAGSDGNALTPGTVGWHRGHPVKSAQDCLSVGLPVAHEVISIHKYFALRTSGVASKASGQTRTMWS